MQTTNRKTALRSATCLGFCCCVCVGRHKPLLGLAAEGVDGTCHWTCFRATCCTKSWPSAAYRHCSKLSYSHTLILSYSHRHIHVPLIRAHTLIESHTVSYSHTLRTSRHSPTSARTHRRAAHTETLTHMRGGTRGGGAAHGQGRCRRGRGRRRAVAARAMPRAAAAKARAVTG